MMGAKQFLGLFGSLDKDSLERVADDLLAPKYSNHESYMDLVLGMANLRRTRHGLIFDENAGVQTYQLMQDSIKHATQEIGDRTYQNVAGVIDDLIGNPQLAYLAILGSDTRYSQDPDIPNYFLASQNTDLSSSAGHGTRRKNILPLSAIFATLALAGALYLSGAYEKIQDYLSSANSGSSSPVTLVTPITQEIYEPTVTVTFTPQPTLTISPTITPTPTATVTATLSPTPTQTSTNTPVPPKSTKKNNNSDDSSGGGPIIDDGDGGNNGG